MSDVDLLMGKSLVMKGDVAAGIKLLERVSHDASFSVKGRAFYELAKIHLQAGDVALGELSLDSMYATLNQSQPPIYIEGAYSFAIDHYLATGNQKKIALYAQGIRQEKAVQEKNGMMKSVTQSLVRMELEKQQKMMVRKVEDMEQRKLLDILAICILVCCILGGFLYYRKKRKESHAKSQVAQRKLAETQQRLASMTEDKVQVEQSLASMEKDKQQMEQSLASISKDKEQVEKQLRNLEQKDVDKVKAGVSLLDILKEKGDKKFKEYFNRSYPYFLRELRLEAEHITSKEELYCMLIALGQSNEELATVFNVARSSVTIAKYRLRKKLPLSEELTMEKFLENLLERNHI